MQETSLPWNTVWITGASSGIGEALARAMDERCNSVALSARSAEKLEAIENDGISLKAFPVDVTDRDAVDACVRNIQDGHGPIELAVLCAGIGTLIDARSLDADAVRETMDVNYMGVVNAIAALLPAMIEQRRGHIAVVSSVAGYRGLPRSAAYGPTKAALINLCEILKSELNPYGITISLVTPGFVDTPMTARNPFPMPGLMSAPEAAERLLAGLVSEKYEIAFPTVFARTVKALRLLPNPLFFWFIRRFVLKQRRRRQEDGRSRR